MNDLKFAFRQLLKNPGFTAVAVLTLALGIGANTAMFSVVYSILLRPYHYPEADRVVNVGMVWTKMPWGDLVQEISPLTFLEIKESARSFSVIGFIEADKKADLHLNDRALRFNIAKITPGVWSVARVNPILGRYFEERDLASGESNLAVLSHELWRGSFNGEREIIGRKIRLDDRLYEVIGVMPPGFSVAANQAKLWIPKVFSTEEKSENARGTCAFQAIGRLNNGVSVAQVRQELKALYAGYLERDPGARDLTEQTGQGYGAAPLSTWVNARSSGSTLFSMQIAAALVLLLGCLNIAGVLVMQGHKRLKEFALRNALGASRGRLARQLLLETVTLFLLGGAMGALVAAAALRYLPEHFDLNQTMPYGQLVQFDLRMLALTLGLSLATGLVAGSLPVFFATRNNLSGVLQAQSRYSTGGNHRRWAQSALVVAQVSLSLVLLAAAGVTVRNLRGLLGKGFGIAVENRIVARVALPGYRYGSDFQATQEKINPFKEQALEKIRSLPGVKNATVSNRVPLSADWPQKFGFGIPGYQPTPGEGPGVCFAYQVHSGYFRTVGLPLIRGRDLEPTDDANSTPVVVISEKIARKYFSGRDAIGGRFTFFGRECQIVGVVDETQNVPLSFGNASTVYLSTYQWPIFNDEAVFIVHTGLPAEVMTQAVTKALNGIDPLLSVQVASMVQMQRSAILTQTAPMEIGGFFAVVAVLLTAIGLYGVLASSVTQRTKELGIRMALGAQHSSIFHMVLSWGGALALTGIALGALVSVPLLRWIKPLMVETDATRFDTLLYAACLVFIVTTLASYFPARRAARVDPMVALRAE